MSGMSSLQLGPCVHLSQTTHLRLCKAKPSLPNIIELCCATMSSCKGLENELVRRYGGGKSADQLKAVQAQKMFSCAKSWAIGAGHSVNEKPGGKELQCAH